MVERRMKMNSLIPKCIYKYLSYIEYRLPEPITTSAIKTSRIVNALTMQSPEKQAFLGASDIFL